MVMERGGRFPFLCGRKYHLGIIDPVNPGIGFLISIGSSPQNNEHRGIMFSSSLKYMLFQLFHIIHF